MKTLQEAYQMAKSNHGAAEIDGVTFEAIEESGVESFLTGRIGPQHVSAHGGAEEGDSEGRGTQVRVLSIPPSATAWFSDIKTFSLDLY